MHKHVNTVLRVPPRLPQYKCPLASLRPYPRAIALLSTMKPQLAVLAAVPAMAATVPDGLAAPNADETCTPKCGKSVAYSESNTMFFVPSVNLCQNA